MSSAGNREFGVISLEIRRSFRTPKARRAFHQAASSTNPFNNQGELP
jgi:hypothetical protein